MSLCLVGLLDGRPVEVDFAGVLGLGVVADVERGSLDGELGVREERAVVLGISDGQVEESEGEGLLDVLELVGGQVSSRVQSGREGVVLAEIVRKQTVAEVSLQVDLRNDNEEFVVRQVGGRDCVVLADLQVVFEDEVDGVLGTDETDVGAVVVVLDGVVCGVL